MTSLSTQTADAVRLDPAELRQALSRFPQGVVVIGADTSAGAEGLVASTFTVGVSLDPPLVSFAVQRSSGTWARLRDSLSNLGVSVFGADQSGIIRQLAGRDRAARFHGVERTVWNDGSLVLDGSPLWMRTRVYNQLPAGDHDLVLLEVLEVGSSEVPDPVIFHRSGFRSLSG